MAPPRDEQGGGGGGGGGNNAAAAAAQDPGSLQLQPTVDAGDSPGVGRVEDTNTQFAQIVQKNRTYLS